MTGMIVMALACLVGIVVAVKGYAWVWTKGSQVSRLTVSLAMTVFFLVMGYSNIDVSRLAGLAFCIAAVIQLLTAMVAFNALFPTKEVPK